MLRTCLSQYLWLFSTDKSTFHRRAEDTWLYPLHPWQASNVSRDWKHFASMIYSKFVTIWCTLAMVFDSAYVASLLLFILKYFVSLFIHLVGIGLPRCRQVLLLLCLFLPSFSLFFSLPFIAICEGWKNPSDYFYSANIFEHLVDMWTQALIFSCLDY